MDIFTLKTWLIFYLLSFAALLWALFLSTSGTMLWISLFLVIVVVGVNFTTVFSEMKRHAERKELMKTLSRDVMKEPASRAGTGK